MTHDYRRPMEPLPGFGDEPEDEGSWPDDLAEPRSSDADTSDEPEIPDAPATQAAPVRKGLATVILDDVGELQGGMVRAPLEDRISGVQPIDDGSTDERLVRQAERAPTPARTASSGGRGGNLWFVLGIMAVLFVAGGGAFLLGAFNGSGTGIVVASPSPSVDASIEASVQPTAIPSDTTVPSTEPSVEPTAVPTAVPTPAPTVAPTPNLTPGPGQFIYVVKVGETLSDLSARFGVTVEAIVAANHLPDKNLILTGQHLIIPAK